jgi:putative transposase
MKGKYNGCHMITYGSILPRAASLSRLANKTINLTTKERFRIKVLDWHKAHGKNQSLTARHFGLGRMTVYRWVKKFNQKGIYGLKDQSRRPFHLRRPTTDFKTENRIVALRKQYPAWSKHKLKVLLAKDAIQISASSIGRVLKRRNLINPKVSKKRKRAALFPKKRFPKGLQIREPGDLIQIDVKYINLIAGRKFYQFTAIDVLSKNRVLDVYASESSLDGAKFLQECLEEFPFPIKAIQTDNGASFLKYFDRLCKLLNLPHYFIYPRSPKQNTYVENSHLMDEKEFYQQGQISSNLKVMKERIKQRQHIWNYIRPHQALNQLTPKEYLEKLKRQNLPTGDVIVLQT